MIATCLWGSGSNGGPTQGSPAGTTTAAISVVSAAAFTVNVFRLR